MKSDLRLSSAQAGISVQYLRQAWKALPATHLGLSAAVGFLQIYMRLHGATGTSIWRGITLGQGTLKSPCQHTRPVPADTFGLRFEAETQCK